MGFFRAPTTYPRHRMSTELPATRRRRRRPDAVTGSKGMTWRSLLILAAVLWLPVLDAASPKNKKEEDSYTIGGVLSGYESEKHFKETIEVGISFNCGICN